MHREWGSLETILKQQVVVGDCSGVEMMTEQNFH